MANPPWMRISVSATVRSLLIQFSTVGATLDLPLGDAGTDWGMVTPVGSVVLPLTEECSRGIHPAVFTPPPEVLVIWIPLFL